MNEKTLKFNTLKELSESEIWCDKKISATITHYDKLNKKYITKIEYGK